jgi:hypothetical protein
LDRPFVGGDSCEAVCGSIAIGLEVMTESHLPMVLNCGHVLCKPCLQKLSHSACPQCRTAITTSVHIPVISGLVAQYVETHGVQISLESPECRDTPITAPEAQSSRPDSVVTMSFLTDDSPPPENQSAKKKAIRPQCCCFFLSCLSGFSLFVCFGFYIAAIMFVSDWLWIKCRSVIPLVFFILMIVMSVPVPCMCFCDPNPHKQPTTFLLCIGLRHLCI